MAIPTDPSFGAGFDADAFRSAITSTMQMGMPSATSEQVTFCWLTHNDYEVEDNAGNPYDWTATPTDTSTEAPNASGEVIVPVAVEFVARSQEALGTPFGQIDTPKVILTLLDDAYEQVKTADYVMINGSQYDIDFSAPPTGLFGVTVYTIYATAVDES